MNYCHRCQSHYEKPGTCNCFAEKPAPEPIQVTPPLTYPWVYPIYIPWKTYPDTWEPWRITWGTGDPLPPPYYTTCAGATTGHMTISGSGVTQTDKDVPFTLTGSFTPGGCNA